MEQNNIGSDVQQLEDFLNDIELSLVKLNLPDCAFDPYVNEYLNLSHEDFLSITPQEAQTATYKINQYLLFLSKEIESNSNKLNWCEEIINRAVAKTYKDFDSYMKYEIRRQAVIYNDDFIRKVDIIRMKVSAILNSLKSRVKYIESMMSIFQRKSYNDNR